MGEVRVAAVTEIHFVDTTLRDGQLSLWAYGMKTGMVLPVADQMDQAGFLSMEITGNAIYPKAVRELREDPWERLDLVTQKIRNTPLRAIRNRYLSAFQMTPPVLSDLWMERLFAHGVREVRISDGSNTPAHWQRAVRVARQVGLHPILNLIFTLSPRHTDEYYAHKARAAAHLKPHRICLKDPGGLLTPERTRILVPIILANSSGIPVEIHTHCSVGLGPICCLEAVKAGIRIVNTAIPPLANGSSLPSVYNVAENLRALGYQPLINEQALAPVSDHFAAVARSEGLPMGVPPEYDVFHYHHQVPGGMISNLKHQLKQVRLEDRLREVLEETARVRAEFGFPIMVTPYAQFVGTQAALNVIGGERYKQVTDQVIEYALGYWGEEESTAINPDIRDTILDRPRARELAQTPPPEPSLKEIRRQLGAESISDDELLLWYLAGKENVLAMRTHNMSVRPSYSAKVVRTASPVAIPTTSCAATLLVDELTKRKGLRQVHIEKGSFVLHLDGGKA